MHPRKIYPFVVLAALLAGGCGKDKEAVPVSKAPAQAAVAVPEPAKAPEPPKAAGQPEQEPAKSAVKPAVESAVKPALSGKRSRPSEDGGPLPAGAGGGIDASAQTRMPAVDRKGFMAEISGHRALAVGAGPGGRGVAIEVTVRNASTETLSNVGVIARLRDPDANYRYPIRKIIKEIPAGGSQKADFEVQTIKALAGQAALIFEARVPARGRSGAAVYEFDAATLLPRGEADPASAGLLNPPSSGMSRFEAGETMPDFAFPDLAGKKVSLSGLAGKTYLVFVCATWSPHCNKLPESTNAWHAKFADKGLRIVEIFFDDPAKVKAFVEKKALSNVVLLATQKEVEDLFKMKAFPVFYILNADRAVQWRRDGFRDELRIEFEVEQALEEALD